MVNKTLSDNSKKKKRCVSMSQLQRNVPKTLKLIMVSGYHFTDRVTNLGYQRQIWQQQYTKISIFIICKHVYTLLCRCHLQYHTRKTSKVCTHLIIHSFFYITYKNKSRNARVIIDYRIQILHRPSFLKFHLFPTTQ